jgi:peptide/nickel transport system ATP-binding protein
MPNKEHGLLEVNHLTKYFPTGDVLKPKQVHALDDVSFAIQRGQVVALVGESGSGKSTTARLIARLMPPTRGEIVFRGRDVLKTEPKEVSLAYRSAVQMIFQDPFSALNPVHSIQYFLGRPLLIHKKAHGRRDLDEKIQGLLTAVGLTPPQEFLDKFPHQLSGGQRQRVAIARALAVDPQILLADEPISMLDVSIRIGILNLMEGMKDERGIGVLYITHDIASARYIGDQIMVMCAGHLVESARAETLVQRPAHPYTQLLLSAVPNPHAGLTKQRVEARGEVPSLIDPPPGCPFAACCPHVMAICRQIMPDNREIEPDHWTRCHLYGSGAEASRSS